MFLYCRALISKGNSYTLIIKQFDIDFIYTTSDAQTVVKTTSIRNINLAQGVWKHVAFTVYGRHLSVFTNGQLQRTVVLDGIINDFTAEARIGQQANGILSYDILAVIFYSLGLLTMFSVGG